MDIFPDEVIKNAIDLRCIGIHEFAWRYDYALMAVYALNENNHIILGGDVYNLADKDGFLSSTRDSWYFNKNSIGNNVAESNEKALDYINKYHNRNGDYFCYSIVVDLEGRRDG